MNVSMTTEDGDETVYISIDSSKDTEVLLGNDRVVGVHTNVHATIDRVAAAMKEAVR